MLVMFALGVTLRRGAGADALTQFGQRGHRNSVFRSLRSRARL